MQNRGAAHPRRGQLSLDERTVRYHRLIVRDGFQYEIPHWLALYLLDLPNKAERLAASSRQHPLISNSGFSLIWRESRKIMTLVMRESAGTRSAPKPKKPPSATTVF